MFEAIDWSRPEWLVALVLVPVVIATIVWSSNRRQQALDAFSEALVRDRTQPLPARRRQVRGVLLVLSLTALVLAVAAFLVFRVINKPRFADFMIATEAEMNKVSWSSKKELKNATVVVLVLTFSMAIYLLVMDRIWENILTFLGVLRFS